MTKELNIFCSLDKCVNQDSKCIDCEYLVREETHKLTNEEVINELTSEEAINTLNSLKQYYNDKNEDSYVGFDNVDNEALDMAIKALGSWDKYSSKLWKMAYDSGYKDGIKDGIQAME